MNYLSTILILLISFSSSVMLRSNSIDNSIPAKSAFIKAEIEDAEILAIREGKMMIIDFNAKWCLPCRWMDEKTFVDMDLINVMQDNFISLQYDIESFDGVALKMKYSITKLPTILIISPEGEEIRRFQESLSANALRHELTNIIASNSFKKRPHHLLERDPLERKKTMIAESYEIGKDKIEEAVFRLQYAVFSSLELARGYINSFESKNSLIIEKVVIREKELYSVRTEEQFTLQAASNKKNELSIEDNVMTLIKKVQ